MRGVGNLTRATYATAYCSFLEAGNFLRMRLKYDCALRGNPRGVLSILVSFRLLPAPPEDRILRVRRLSLPPIVVPF